MAEFNQESVNDLMDHIIKAMNVCLANKDTWKSDKKKTMMLLEANCLHLYENYPRICSTIANGHDIQPLLAMMKTFAKVQQGSITLDEANDLVTNGLNEKYVDGVLYSDKLVKEREEKIKAQTKN
jgi:hypothetical protein